MINTFEINNVTLSIKEYENQRLVTFKDIDTVHKRPSGTAKKAFYRNKNRFVENEDYYLIKQDNPLSISGTFIVPPKGITLLTESGYYMIAKVFDDDIAWKVQKQLIKGYFRAKELSENTSSQDNTLLLQEIQSLRQEISELKATSNKPLPAPKYSQWKATTFNKLRTITETVNQYSDEILSLSDVMSIVFKEYQDTYDVDLSDYTYQYKHEYGLPESTKVYELDVINHYKELKRSYTLTLDSIMERLHIPTDKYVTKNIFDIVAEKLNTAS